MGGRNTQDSVYSDCGRVGVWERERVCVVLLRGNKELAKILESCLERSEAERVNRFVVRCPVEPSGEYQVTGRRSVVRLDHRPGE